ncbi:tRNA pseudouridine(38-40) synthase TruA [Flavobacterium sp. GA093]|uniref:tRNA pseudouridine synthase A n=1 Tax=Flavobacterium hydrocarbonoxydans TaxID=2683249 RepID=A0A6I4NT53_9FLAO|nr:tRNA pseudouridine(38-40) synthase TruA [Flavobacterium hydrocarbonoxydans]MWB96232.1 tRNA pseudouridine(38-40) synthase TruA [Flavobacterium hydrocarbonoxydans]
MRYFIRFAYNGTHYHGWQFQPNAASVQETLNKGLSVLLNTTINTMGAGRTDTGVHAEEMYAHFDFEKEIDIPNFIHKLNSYLPKDIAVFAIFLVHDDAHCRFDATKRTYEYHINTVKNPFSEELSWYFNQKLDVDLMNEAAGILLNHTDFQCFSKVNTDVNTFDCTIFEAYWKKEKNKLIFTISANRFLRNMVRSIVGTLINIGLHKISLADFENIIASKSREKAGFSVPAHGLYLTKIEYPYLDD